MVDICIVCLLCCRCHGTCCYLIRCRCVIIEIAVTACFCLLSNSPYRHVSACCPTHRTSMVLPNPPSSPTPHGSASFTVFTSTAWFCLIHCLHQQCMVLPNPPSSPTPAYFCLIHRLHQHCMSLPNSPSSPTPHVAACCLLRHCPPSSLLCHHCTFYLAHREEPKRGQTEVLDDNNEWVSVSLVEASDGSDSTVTLSAAVRTSCVVAEWALCAALCAETLATQSLWMSVATHAACILATAVALKTIGSSDDDDPSEAPVTPEPAAARRDA